jgi:hypothetical protein
MYQENAMTILKMADMRFAEIRVAKRVKVSPQPPALSLMVLIWGW